MMERLTKGEMRLGTLMEFLAYAALYGIAFALAYPTEFERLWRQSFETLIDSTKWSEMRSHGLAIPERQELYPLATAEQDTLDQTGAYVRLYRPELLEPLTLGGYGSG